MNKLIIENTYRSLLIYMLYEPSWKKHDYVIVKGRISNDFISRFKGKVNKVSISDDFPIISLKSPFSSIYSRLHFLNSLKSYDEIYGNVLKLKCSQHTCFTGKPNTEGNVNRVSIDSIAITTSISLSFKIFLSR